VRQLLDWGAITEEEAKFHPDRHMLNNVVGIGGGNINVGICSGRWHSEQVFLLGTDGMAYRDEPETLSEIISSQGDPVQVVEKLKTASLKKGGSDNFTVIVVGRSLEKNALAEAVKRSRELFYMQAGMETISTTSVSS
jgi:protein phosphatase